MSFFRNPEIKRSILLHFTATVIFTGAAFFYNFFTCVLIFLICVVFTLLHLYPTYQRYKQIRNLSQNIDRVLHGLDTISFSDYKEGELSILKIEIDKMILCLKEQRDVLKQDKISLANSLADISHQIRTPLTSIHLILSLLGENDLTEARQLELVLQLSMLISRIDWLIEALLKISRLDANTVTFTPETLSCSKVVRAAAEPLEIPIELREQHLSITGSTTQESIYADYSWTVEAIGNILKNCMEHTPDGGEIQVLLSENAIFTEIIIQDNGPGFAPEDIPHVFERFYKGSSDNQQSIGIGLALTRMILSKQNATIKAENRSHGGARFIIHFYK